MAYICSFTRFQPADILNKSGGPVQLVTSATGNLPINSNDLNTLIQGVRATQVRTKIFKWKSIDQSHIDRDACCSCISEDASPH